MPEFVSSLSVVGVDDTTRKALTERNLRPAVQPKIELPNEDGAIEQVLLRRGEVVDDGLREIGRARDRARKLRFDEAGRDGAAVDLDEGAVLPGAAAVDGAREELLADPRLPRDEDRRVGRRHLLDAPDVDVLHGVARGRIDGERIHRDVGQAG
mgnify:CR=1 FL=1